MMFSPGKHPEVALEISGVIVCDCRLGGGGDTWPGPKSGSQSISELAMRWMCLGM